MQMVRINKDAAPEKLRAGIAQTEQDCTNYDAHRADYIAGRRKFEFRRNVYGDASVKTTLKAAQYKKCCYCEGRSAHDPGEVEHYRPKGATRQDRRAKALYPGYYWLVYAWENLYYSCRGCNLKKAQFFPLAKPTRRARSHHDSLGQERPLILDPGGTQDPRNHITFRDEMATGVTRAGRITVEIVDLNREELSEERLARLNELKTMRALVHVCEDDKVSVPTVFLAYARQKLATATHPTNEYSAMFADFFDAASQVEPTQTPKS